MDSSALTFTGRVFPPEEQVQILGSWNLSVVVTGQKEDQATSKRHHAKVSFMTFSVIVKINLTIII